MNVTEPTTTQTIAPADLNSNGWYRSISVAGVATTHEIWVSESGDRAVYLVAPAGGPMNAITLWSRTERPLPAWSFGEVWTDIEKRLTEQELAENYAIRAARNEVRTEMALPEVDA